MQLTSTRTLLKLAYILGFSAKISSDNNSLYVFNHEGSELTSLVFLDSSIEDCKLSLKGLYA